MADLSSFKKLQAEQIAGMFAVAYPLEEKGEYTFTLAIKSLSGKTFADPLIYGGKISYQEKSRAPIIQDDLCDQSLSC